jgi:hypothetical protein
MDRLTSAAEETTMPKGAVKWPSLATARRSDRGGAGAKGRRFSAVDLRPADRAGASVLNHVSGERGGPPGDASGLPDQPQSAGE